MKLKISDRDDVYYPVVSVMCTKLIGTETVDLDGAKADGVDKTKLKTEAKTEAVIKIDRTTKEREKELVIETVKVKVESDAEMTDRVEVKVADEIKTTAEAVIEEKVTEEEAVETAGIEAADDRESIGAEKVEVVVEADEREKADQIEVKMVGKEGEEQKGEAVLANAVAEINMQSRRRRRWYLGAWCEKISTVIVAIVAIVAAGLVGLRLAGFRVFTVMSGSMEPEYPVGSMIYVRPVDYTELKVGDVISYVANGENTIVTHRITEIKVDEGDASVLRFRTKGDMNDLADTRLVHYKNVLGTPVVAIPLIGYVAYNVQQPPGIYVALVAGTLLLAWTFMPGTLEERRRTARKSVSGV